MQRVEALPGGARLLAASGIGGRRGRRGLERRLLLHDAPFGGQRERRT